MGVNLTPITVRKTLSLDDLRGRSLAVDASNYLYQFLSLVRTKDGTPLKDSSGNVTSHLYGLAFRSTRLMLDFRIRLAFVFDGEPPDLKRREIQERREKRERARREWQQALKAGDYEKAFSKAVAASRLTRSMIEDAKKLLTLLGIPYVQAPSEAEAQTAYIARRGGVWAASSKDYDSLLFGAPRLLRFLTIKGKEYLPSLGVARPLKPELITLSQFLQYHEITHPQLIDLAIMVGTDFNEGIKGVGPKTALKLVKKHGRLENLPRDLFSRVPKQYEKVREIYLHPPTTSEYNLAYSHLHEEELFDFLCDQRNFARKRVETVVRRMQKFYRSKKQTRLEDWFRGATGSSS